jgi:hypothetical protein
MNVSNFDGQITMKYNRDKEVHSAVDIISLISQSFYIVGDCDSGKCEQAYIKVPGSDIRFVKVLANIKSMIERTVSQTR